MDEQYKAVEMLGALRCKNPDHCDSAILDQFWRLNVQSRAPMRMM